MKTLKFRLLKKDDHWYIQLRRFFRWKTHSYLALGFGGSVWIQRAYKSKKEAMKYLPEVVDTREDRTRFIQYPTIRMF